MNKKIKRLIAMWISCIMICTTVLNPSVLTFADEMGSEETTTSAVETEQEVSTTTVNPTTDSSEEETTTVVETTEETSNKIYTISDISLKSEVKGHYIRKGVSLIYGKDAPTYEIEATLKSVGEDSIEKIYVKDSKETLWEEDSNKGSLKVSLLKDFNDELTICYVLSNGQELSQSFAVVDKDYAPNMEFVSDTELDTLEYKGTNAKTVKIKKVDTIILDGTIDFTVDDSCEIQSVVATEDDNSFNLKNNGGQIYSLSTTLYKDGKHTIEVTATDKLGNANTITCEFSINRKDPEIKGISYTPSVKIKDNITYTNKSINFTLEDFSDDGRIISVVLKHNEKIEEIKGNTFIINESGTYSIEVTTVTNKVITYSIEDLFEGITSKIVFDTKAPSISVNVDNKDLKDVDYWLTGNPRIVQLFTDDNSILSATITVNGKEFKIPYDDIKNTTLKNILELSKDVPVAVDGIYNIEVVCEDYAGNVGKETYKVKGDFTAPIVDMSVEGAFVEEDGCLYVDGSLVIGNRNNSYDIGSGIASVELLKGDTVIATNAPFSISEDGEYFVRITDGVGLSTIISVRDLIGNVNTNKILIDSLAPTISYIGGFIPNLVEGGVNWYNGYPELKYSINDDYMKSVVIRVNGDEKVNSLSKDNTYTVDTNGYTGTVNVEVEATDKFGHIGKDAFTYRVDTTAPNITSTQLMSTYKEKGGVLFFKEKPTVSIKASDSEVGIGSYILNGKPYNSGSFTLDSGSYSLEIKDKLGNTSGIKTLKELLGLPSNEFIVDSEKPSISAKRPSGDVDGWFAKDITYTANLKDNQGIDNATITINGKVVAKSNIESINKTSESISASTSSVETDKDGMYKIKITVVDNAGNTDTWSDTIYIDREAPTIKTVTFTGTGNKEGNEIKGSGKYGFYFRGSATCEIGVYDGIVSSGMHKLYVELKPSNGKVTKKTLSITDGDTKFNIPENFKGFVSMYATDRVGNKSTDVNPDGIITESTKYFKNNTSINIKLPETKYRDSAGTRLYSSNIKAEAIIGSTFSGIKEIEWGVGEDTLGLVKVNNNGKVSGSIKEVISKDNNLVLNLSKTLSLTGNANGLRVWVKVVDRTGNSSMSTKTFSIDKDKPVISLKYNKTNNNNYYNSNRVATITVKERNFNPSKFKVTGSISLGQWVHKENEWVNTITFSKDGDYQFDLQCIDRAGNVAHSYKSSKFTIDKTKPTISVSWGGSTAKNGNYYNSARTATVTVKEHNFDASAIKLSGSGSLSSWSSNGDIHTAKVNFGSNGTYNFSISGSDKAGNKLNTYTSGKFIIDQSKPKISIEGIEKKVSYKKDISFTVKLSDEYLDDSVSSVTLSGKRQGNIGLQQNGNVYTLSSISKQEKYDGVYTLSVVAIDKAGNTVKEEVPFSVNRFGSSYKCLSNKLMGSYIATPESITINEYNVDALDTSKAKVLVILDGKEIKLNSSLVSVKETKKDDKYVYTYSIDKGAFTKDGKYLIQVYSAAKEGAKYSSVSEEYSFVLDSKAPDLIISGVHSNTSYKDSSRRVTIDVRDTTDIKTLDVYLNNSIIKTKNDNGVYSFDIPEGTKQNIKVVASDMAGNSTTSEVKDITITSNWWVYLISQVWFKILIIIISLIVLAIIVLIIKNILSGRKEEKESLEQNVKLYTASSSTSNTLDTKDKVENLDKEE